MVDSFLRLATLAGALLLGGCSLIPTYERPAAPVPLAYPGASGAPAAEAGPAWAARAPRDRAEVLRRAFVRHLHVSPTEYRERFAAR